MINQSINPSIHQSIIDSKETRRTTLLALQIAAMAWFDSPLNDSGSFG
jgi:hypothetical protein